MDFSIVVQFKIVNGSVTLKSLCTVEFQVRPALFLTYKSVIFSKYLVHTFVFRKAQYYNFSPQTIYILIPA